MDAEQEWIAKYRAALDQQRPSLREAGLVRSLSRKLRSLFGKSEQVQELPITSSREQTEFSSKSRTSAEKSAGIRITSIDSLLAKPVQSSATTEEDLHQRAS